MCWTCRAHVGCSRAQFVVFISAYPRESSERCDQLGCLPQERGGAGARIRIWLCRADASLPPFFALLSVVGRVFFLYADLVVKYCSVSAHHHPAPRHPFRTRECLSPRAFAFGFVAQMFRAIVQIVCMSRSSRLLAGDQSLLLCRFDNCVLGMPRSRRLLAGAVRCIYVALAVVCCSVCLHPPIHTPPPAHVCVCRCTPSRFC